METKRKDKPDEPVLEEVDDLQMSRGERPEVVVNFAKIRDKYVFDENGNKIRFGDIYKHQKTIIVFTRHFLCFVCKDYVEDLAIIPLEYLQEAGVRLVVIGPAPYKYIKEFKKLTGYQYTIYTDPEREVYKLLGLKEAMDHGDRKDNKHVKQSIMMGVLRSTWRAMQTKAFQGDVKQQGGSFIFGPGEVIHHAHVDMNSLGHTPINIILQTAGVAPVSFPNDSRVQDL